MKIKLGWRMNKIEVLNNSVTFISHGGSQRKLLCMQQYYMSSNRIFYII